SPVIRYRTGDIVELDSQPCPCGRRLIRLKGGILGRVDDMLTIRGNNVFPTAVEAILREFPEIVEYRLSAATRQAMAELRIEIETTLDDRVPDGRQRLHDLLMRIETTLQSRLHFRPELVSVSAESLPRFELKGRRFFRES